MAVKREMTTIRTALIDAPLVRVEPPGAIVGPADAVATLLREVLGEVLAIRDDDGKTVEVRILSGHIQVRESKRANAW